MPKLTGRLPTPTAEQIEREARERREKYKVDPSNFEGLGRMVAQLMALWGEAQTMGIPDGMEADGVSIVFQWKPTGEDFMLELRPHREEDEDAMVIEAEDDDEA